MEAMMSLEIPTNNKIGRTTPDTVSRITTIRTDSKSALSTKALKFAKIES
jgi:hypothetical protein